MGTLICDGVDALVGKGATLEVIAPKVGGARAADGTLIPAAHMVDGGPSVLLDAVAVILTPEGAKRLAGDVAARDFVSDSYAHCKFIAHTLEAVGIESTADEGLIPLAPRACAAFVTACRRIRLWARERALKP